MKTNLKRFANAVRKIEYVNGCPLTIGNAMFNTIYGDDDNTLSYDIFGGYFIEHSAELEIDREDMIYDDDDLEIVLDALNVDEETLNAMYADIESERYAYEEYFERIAYYKEYDGANKTECIEDFKWEVDDAYSHDFISAQDYNDIMTMIKVNFE